MEKSNNNNNMSEHIQLEEFENGATVPVEGKTDVLPSFTTPEPMRPPPTKRQIDTSEDEEFVAQSIRGSGFDTTPKTVGESVFSKIWFYVKEGLSLFPSFFSTMVALATFVFLLFPAFIEMPLWLVTFIPSLGTWALLARLAWNAIYAWTYAGVFSFIGYCQGIGEQVLTSQVFIFVYQYLSLIYMGVGIAVANYWKSVKQVPARVVKYVVTHQIRASASEKVQQTRQWLQKIFAIMKDHVFEIVLYSLTVVSLCGVAYKAYKKKQAAKKLEALPPSSYLDTAITIGVGVFATLAARETGELKEFLLVFKEFGFIRGLIHSVIRAWKGLTQGERVPLRPEDLEALMKNMSATERQRYATQMLDYEQEEGAYEKYMGWMGAIGRMFIPSEEIKPNSSVTVELEAGSTPPMSDDELKDFVDKFYGHEAIGSNMSQKAKTFFKKAFDPMKVAALFIGEQVTWERFAAVASSATLVYYLFKFREQWMKKIEGKPTLMKRAVVVIAGTVLGVVLFYLYYLKAESKTKKVSRLITTAKLAEAEKATKQVQEMQVAMKSKEAAMDLTLKQHMVNAAEQLEDVRLKLKQEMHEWKNAQALKYQKVVDDVKRTYEDLLRDAKAYAREEVQKFEKRLESAPVIEPSYTDDEYDERRYDSDEEYDRVVRRAEELEELYAAEEEYMRRHRGQFDEDDLRTLRHERDEDVKKAQSGYYDADDFHIFAERDVSVTPTWNRLAEMEDEPSNRDRVKARKDYDPHHGKGGRTRVVTHSRDFEASGEAKVRNVDPNVSKTMQYKRRKSLDDQWQELCAEWKKRFQCDVPTFRVPKVIKGKAKRKQEEIRMLKAEMGKRAGAKDKPVLYGKLPQEATSVVMKGIVNAKEQKTEAKIQTVKFQDVKTQEKKSKEEKENPPVVTSKPEADIGGKAQVDLYQATMNVPYIVYGPDTEYSGTVLKGVFKVGNYLYTCHHPHNEKVGEFVTVVLYQNDKLVNREQVQILEVYPDLDIQKLSLPKTFPMKSLNVSVPIPGREVRISWKPQGSLEDGKWFNVSIGKILTIKDGKMAYDVVTKAGASGCPVIDTRTGSLVAWHVSAGVDGQYNTGMALTEDIIKNVFAIQKSKNLN